ncbi:hypothetical protein, partial [Pseudomonas haemolytica]|uniref:hypothetical protein n=1 Tax=Pseudomonas haemolytica TaxID=2600065 RepID=UPI001ADFFAC6
MGGLPARIHLSSFLIFGLDAAANTCRIRLPLMRDQKRKWLKLLKKSSKASENNHLTANEAAVECAP